MLRKFGRVALSIALSGVAVPFACGIALGIFMPQSLLPGADKRLLTALFVGICNNQWCCSNHGNHRFLSGAPCRDYFG